MKQSLLISLLSLFLSFFSLGQATDAYPIGTLKTSNGQLPVKVYSSTDHSDLLEFTKKPNGSLVYISRINLQTEGETEAASMRYILSEFAQNGYQLYNKEGQSIIYEPGQIPEDLKYLVKTPTPAGDHIQLKTDFPIWDPPAGISLGAFTLHFYSLMFVLAFGLGYYLMTKMYKIDGVDTALVEPFAVWTIIGTILGARLGHVFFYERELLTTDIWSVFLPIRTVPDFKFTGFSGLASHGATIMLIFTTLFYALKTLKKNPLWVFDRLVIVVALGGAFVRIGNFFNSEIIGKPAPSGNIFAILFPQMSREYGITVPRFPSQLFESFGYFCLFILLWFLYRKTRIKYRQGWIFGFFMIVLFSIRILVEFLKEPQGDEYLTFAGLNTGQVLSLPFILLGIIALIYSYSPKNRDHSVQGQY